MAAPDNFTTAANVLSPDLAYQDEVVNGVDTNQAQTKYSEERNKRFRDDGYKQYVEPSQAEEYRHFQYDPWIEDDAVTDIDAVFAEKQCKFLIFGAGFGGMLYAIRLIQAGFSARDIRIVDTAGGFGGTWYWNRYPGLMCDIESYCYLPLLEESGYVPRHRYSYGDEIREYANILAKKWDLVDSAAFLTKGQSLEWDETAKEWKAELLQTPRAAQARTLTVRAQFVALVNGALNWPKLPALPGILDYKGHVFHTSRWRYDITGGSQADPQLTKLKDKRVAIIGTGATAVQIVPELARWAKQLYVVQRTPSGVDIRGQQETDPVQFQSQVATGPGWQRERMRNFHAHFTLEEQPAVNLVNDQWTHAPSLVAITGLPNGPQSMDQIPAYLEKLHATDIKRQHCIRQRVTQTVKDSHVAQQLQVWYPSWCKRPAFHDDYLPAFNRDNVTLLDTNGKGLERLNHDSIIVNNETYPVDIIVLATGYRAPFVGSPADKANMTILGCNGVSMSDAWARDGPSTLHGVMDHNFPNLLLSGAWQASLSGNNIFSTDVLAQHAAYIVAEADRRAGGRPCVVSATKTGVDDWATQILMRAASSAAMAGCTPGYFNVEGELDRVPIEGRMKLAQSGLWGSGIEDFIHTLEKWRDAGDMQGIDVSF